MTSVPRRAAIWLGGFLLLLSSGRQVGATAQPPASTLACRCGVAMALGERPAAAESLFALALATDPRDPCALNDLGNLLLMDGDPELGLSLYEEASRIDSVDAGIWLNQGTALWLLGRDEEALRRARRGMMLAGGEAQALALLGLPAPERVPGSEIASGGTGAWNRIRPSHRSIARREEVRSLLLRSTFQVAANDSSSSSPNLPTKSASTVAPASMLTLYWRY